MLSKVKSFGLLGIEGFEVDVETDIINGLPKFDIVGLGDTTVKEAKERIRFAILNSGYKFQNKKITINLAPADVKKEGALFDLPMAACLLGASDEIVQKYLSLPQNKETIFIGELSLDGSLKAVKGVLPILISARKQGFKRFVIPYENINEASYISGVEVFGLKSFGEVIDFVCNKKSFLPVETRSYQSVKNEGLQGLDFCYVKGQARAKRALEIAAAGGHNVIIIGPPGSGKSMLAKCFPSILPDMTFDEALEVTKIHSIAGELDYKKGIVATRPFRTPHHTASMVSLIGGGSFSKPGEISLAHNGVLYLDEFPEYQRHTIETLRQPLEDGVITVARSALTVTYPASFTLIASMNPCPCGNYGAKGRECKCSPSQIHKYLARISGPILDRIDIHIEVDNVSFDDLRSETTEEPSQKIKERVDKARKIQLERFKNSQNYSNAKMSVPATKKYCKLSQECEDLLRTAFDKLKLSARAHDRIIKVARTIADLEGCENIQPEHIAEAISYRSLDRKYI